MTIASQDIKISCHNSVIKGTMAKSNDGHPWRNWKITLVAMDGEKEVKGKLSILLDHVEYILHPTFEEPRRAKKEEPYILQEKGWGEFDMRVVLYFTDNVADPQVLLFDLNFALSNYSKTHTIEFPNASPELLKLLATTPRKGGKKPMSSAPPLKSEKESKPSTSTSSSSQVAKKKPISSSPNAKVSKKSKAESKSTSFSSTASSVTSTKRADKSSQKPSLSSPSLPLARSPSFTDLSPMESSLYSSPAQTNTPESIRAKEEQEVGEVISDMNDDRGEHVYKMSDVYNLNPIHHATLDQSVRDKWNIPQINMMEMAKRIYRMTEEQSEELQNIIIENRPESMRTTMDQNGSVGIDLYSLGVPLLEKLWDYLADMASDDNESFTSQDHHPSDLEFDSDVEQGEYKSEDDDQMVNEINGHLDDIDEPGYHLSDNDSQEEGSYTSNGLRTNGHLNHHTENGGYYNHDNSDMEIQDEDEDY